MISDLLEPLASFGWILFILGLIVTLFSGYKWFNVKKRKLAQNINLGVISETEYNLEIKQNQWLRIFSFSLMATFVLMFFAIISLIYPQRGILGSTIKPLTNIQNDLFPQLKAIKKQQDEIQNDVKDIKEILSGENEVKKLTSTEDYTIVDNLNKKTKTSDAVTLAILYFDNNSGDKQLNPLSKGLADMIITDLSHINILNIVERDKLEAVLKEQKLSNTKEFDTSTACKVGKLLGAKIILVGGFFELLGNLRIDARFIDVETGKILKSDGIDGQTSNFFKLQKQLSWKIIKNLDVKITTEEKVNLQNIEKSNALSFEDAIKYSRSIDFIDQGQKAKAIVILDKIIAKYPDFESAKKALIKIKEP